MLELNDLLAKTGIDAERALVMRHRPTERDLRHALRAFAAERPDLFDAYQSIHGPRVEEALRRAQHVVSFIGHEPGKALFVGIYRVEGWREISGPEWRALETSRVLMALGDRGPDEDRNLLRLFNLVRTDALASWQGKLVVAWPPPERSWWRWSGRNVMPVVSILEESILVSKLPPWNQLVVTWTALETLPRSWKAAMAQWRGVYLIVDRETGKQYVGSAYSDDNILARWMGYARTGHGGNVDLKGRDPTKFQFALLERVSPDLPAEEVIRLEATWKDRLATREFGLNKN